MAVAKAEMHTLAGEGIGHIVIGSTPGARRDTIPAVVVNFDHWMGLYPDASGDDYLVGLGVHAAGEDEAVITFPLIEGLQRYYRDNDLLAESTQVIEVPHRGGRRYGFPHGDVMEQMVSLVDDEHAVLRDNESGRTFTLVPTLTNAYVESQARQLGIDVLHQPDSDITNNKSLLRQAERAYGLHMLPGELITSDTNLDDLAERYSNLAHGVWIKFPTGSGGDTVLHVEHVTTESISEAIGKVRATIWEALGDRRYGISREEFWSVEDIAPKGLPLVIETDARNLGEIVLLGSNHFRTSPQGVEMYGYFRQITGDDGSFIGSERFYPDPELQAKIDARTRRVGQYAIDKGYFATAGEDYIVVRRPDGHLEVFDLELNARPIISEFPDIIGERTGIPTWKNVNVTLPNAVSSMEEFGAIVGEDLYSKGATAGVVPMAFRTIVDADEGVIASPHVKMVILGSEQDQQEIIARLQAKGVKIGQTV